MKSNEAESKTTSSRARNGREPLIEVRHLKKYFPIKQGLFSRTVGQVKAVDDISFTIYANETLGLVGESGCGKTTAGRSLLRLIEPTSGEAFYKDKDLFTLRSGEMRKLRRKLQIIFQEPFSSLNPRMTVDSLIGDAMEVHGIARGLERREKVKSLLSRVGLQPSYINRYPHEFSGGQRQRIGIARALALNPDFIVCDEAVSALDVSVQAQILNLLAELQEEFNLSYLFIAHDLSVVRHISDRVAVMYLGQIVEMAECDDLYEEPLHPYTRALLSAIPRPDPRRKQKRIILKGDVPSPLNPPDGCRFHPRCPACFKPCRTKVPKVIEFADEHWVKCHIYDPDFLDEIPADIKASYLTEAEPKVTLVEVVDEESAVNDPELETTKISSDVLQASASSDALKATTASSDAPDDDEAETETSAPDEAENSADDEDTEQENDTEIDEDVAQEPDSEAPTSEDEEETP